MGNRQANASIMGYNYQFLHSIYQILNEVDDKSEFVVEGIEDLDINKESKSLLVQYKYHEGKNFQRSRVAKPVALMFDHFLSTRKHNHNYRLFIHISDDLPEINVKLIQEILSLDSAKKHLSESSKSLIEDEGSIDEFLKVFYWEPSLKYELMEEMTIEALVENYSINEINAQYFFLPNAFKIINDLAIKKNQLDRTITKTWFNSTLENYKKTLDLDYILRFKSFSSLKRALWTEFSALNIKKNSRDFIVCIGNTRRSGLAKLVINLTKKFYFRGNNSDIRPVTFVISGDQEEIKMIKKNIYSHISQTNELLIMNDGYELYGFNIEVFNCSPFTVSKPLRGKVNVPNFNFKMISLPTYKINKDRIKFNAPVMFSIDGEFEDIDTCFDKFSLKGLSNDQILEIIGG